MISHFHYDQLRNTQGAIPASGAKTARAVPARPTAPRAAFETRCELGSTCLC